MAGLTRQVLGMQAGQDATENPIEGGPRGWHLSPVDVVVLAVLVAGLSIGVALWSKWGFLVAFEALKRYCF